VKFPQLTPPYLEREVAVPVARFCQKKYGKKGFKIEEELDSRLEWRPSIQLKSSAFETLAVEVSEVLFPAIVKTVGYDLLNSHSDNPVLVYVACPLHVYQADARQGVVSQLRSSGFGLFTVDDVGNVIEQVTAIPLIHHISQHEVAQAAKVLPSAVRVKVGRAHDVYRARSYQGLQDVAQVVEALIFGVAEKAHSKGWITKVRGDAADVIDDLYGSTEVKLKQQRAAIGLARGFVRYYRNISSHPPKTRAKAAELIKNCRRGFMMALEVAAALTAASRACGLKVQLKIP
jgi:hypothetical protein